MKKFLFAAVFAALALTSCSNDDSNPPSGTRVKYQITVDHDIIASAVYRRADGALAEGYTELDLTWEREISVQTPFSARLVGGFFNPSDEPQEYTMAISVDGTVVANRTGVVEPDEDVSDELLYDVP